MKTLSTAVPASKPQRKEVPLNVRILAPVAHELDKAVERQNITRSEFVRIAIYEKLKNASL